MAIGDMRKYKIVAEAFYTFAPELQPTVDEVPKGSPTQSGMPTGRFVKIAVGEAAMGCFWIEKKQWHALVSIEGDPELFGSTGPQSAVPPMRWAFEVAIGMLEQTLKFDVMGSMMTAAKLRDALAT